ncbi:DUF5719 family protein [Ornithinimicrobium sp. F0845]|uniref:DUF5719 family protein n=1 Tax=Ornithinimicrobium sp. F0845 TaxID=2926412 RepID=UPI001FF12A2D|nr:DUF5719 family protein [Ornithinimicrobium sp. F0845]MCK0111416.1 DUF5719 family protein [Ornithinimicrobium sp. F0845]
MADYTRRSGPDRPRVDDLFYDNPDPESDQTPLTASVPEDDGRPDGQAAGAEATASASADSATVDVDSGTSDDASPGGDGAAPGGDGAAPDRDGADLASSDDAAPDSDGDRDAEASSPEGWEGDDSGGDDGGPASTGGTGRGRRAAVGRWARAVALVGIAGALVYGAGSGRISGVDLAAALDRSASASVPDGQQAGLAVVTESSIGCVGPDLVGLDDPTVTEPDQTVSVSAGSAPMEALGEGIDPTGTGQLQLAVTPDGATERSAARSDVARLQVSGANWVRGTATGSLAAGFAGSQLALDQEEQQRGLSMAPCTQAMDEAWYIAGGAEPGRAERLILANPTGNPVTADVEVLGAGGPVAVVGGRGIVIAPGGRHVVLVDALAPGEQRPVIHLTTTGGPVLAAVGDRWLEGTLDRGTELTTATAAPATAQVIPAVPGPGAESADSSSVRVGVPGTEQAVVQVRALTAEGPVRVANAVTTVDAGAVADIDVSDLPEGTHAIEVVADAPVVAAAQIVLRAEADGVGEFAWVPAVTPSTGLVGLPLAHRDADPLPRELSVASTEGARVEVVTLVQGSTEVRTEEVPAAGSVTIELDPATESVWVRAVEGSAASALLTAAEDDLGVLVAGTVLPEAPVTHQVRSVAPWLP